MFKVLALLLAAQAADVEFARIEEWAKSQPENGPGKISVGDEFYKASRKFPKDRVRFMDRANESWAAGWPLLQDTWKDRVRQNLRRMFASPVGVQPLPKVWTVETVTASPERVRSGRFAARITMSKDGNLHHAMKAVFAVPPGAKTVDVTAWILTDETESAEDDLKVIVFGGDGKVMTAVGSPIPIDVPAWTKVTVSVPVDGAARFGVFFEFKSTKGVAFVDDVEVKIGDVSLFPKK